MIRAYYIELDLAASLFVTDDPQFNDSRVCVILNPRLSLTTEQDVRTQIGVA